MPGTISTDDIELIIENVGGGGGGKPPVHRDGDGGDGGGGGRGNGGNEGKRPDPPASPNRYVTGMSVGIIAILIFFMAMISAFLLRRNTGHDWMAVRLPRILWVNTAVLLLSSATIETARKRLAAGNRRGFRAFWGITTGLGVLFLVGQFVAWRQLVAQGVFIASNPASSFFYIFTGSHALHLIGGVAMLLFVAARNFEKSAVPQKLAAEVASYYWHFMDALWIFLLALLYLGK